MIRQLAKHTERLRAECLVHLPHVDQLGGQTSRLIAKGNAHAGARPMINGSIPYTGRRHDTRQWLYAEFGRPLPRREDDRARAVGQRRGVRRGHLRRAGLHRQRGKLLGGRVIPDELVMLERASRSLLSSPKCARA